MDRRNPFRENNPNTLTVHVLNGGIILKRCPACGGYNMDDRESCGLCGSSLVDIESVDDRTEPLPPPIDRFQRCCPGNGGILRLDCLLLSSGQVSHSAAFLWLQITEH